MAAGAVDAGNADDDGWASWHMMVDGVAVAFDGDSGAVRKTAMTRTRLNRWPDVGLTMWTTTVRLTSNADG